MGTVYFQNETGEWVKFANISNVTYANPSEPPDCAASTGFCMSPPEMEFRCTVNCSHPRWLFRRLVEGWRTPHGPVRRRMRQRAKRLIAKGIYERVVKQCVDYGLCDRDARMFVKGLILRSRIARQYGRAKG